jgi:hypothetical protein
MRTLSKYELGIAFQTMVGIEEELRSKRLVYVALSDRSLKASVIAVLSRGKNLSGPASIFVETLREKLSRTW